MRVFRTKSRAIFQLPERYLFTRAAEKSNPNHTCTCMAERTLYSEEKKSESDAVDASTMKEANLPMRIAQEHSYSRLAPFRSTSGSGGRDPFPTVTLFPERVRKRVESKPMVVGQEESRFDAGSQPKEWCSFMSVLYPVRNRMRMRLM